MSAELPVQNLASLLREKFRRDFTIDRVDWKNLTDPGENFGSLIIAVNVTVRFDSGVETHNVVVKLPPPSAWLQELFNTPFTFQKELTFYRDLTPQFIALQRENGISDAEESWLGADFYGGRMGLEGDEKFDNQAAIVLQNLNFKGFKMVDRMVGLNLNQTQLAIRKLAKLHAIGIAMREKKPEVFEKQILPALAEPDNKTALNCVMDMIKKSIEDLSSIPEAAPYMNSVHKTLEYIEKVESSASHSKDEWATILHRDFWVNNMMFKSDESGNAVDVKMVDFQLYVYDYGVNDLIFFLVSSPTTQVIENDFDSLVDLYFSSFVKALETMKVDVSSFSRDELIRRLNEYAVFKFPQCMMMNQVIKSKPGAAPKMEEIHNKDVFLTIGSGEIYFQKMLQTVKFFDKRGWLKK